MEEKEAVEKFDRLKEEMFRRISNISIDKDLKEKLESAVSGWMSGGRVHLLSIYTKGYSVGEGFSVVKSYYFHEEYRHWVQGIHRHIDLCSELLDGHEKFSERTNKIPQTQ